MPRTENSKQEKQLGGTPNDRYGRSRAVRVAFYEDNAPSKDRGARPERSHPSPFAIGQNTHGSGSVGVVQVLPIGKPSLRFAEGWAYGREANSQNQQRQKHRPVLFVLLNNPKLPLASIKTQSKLQTQ
jgi:hypothetical protein